MEVLADREHEKPVVSVVITTFNSEKWIARAIDSVLEQRTSFPVELVVSDDYSQDRTVEIVRSYQPQSPFSLKAIARTANVGMQRNYYEAFDVCQGDFIAWLDADDFWIDDCKLEMQVDMLRNDSTISICAHPVYWLEQEGQISKRTPSLPSGRYGVLDILQRNFIPTPSVVFRAGLHRELPSWYFDLAPVTDWPLWTLAAQKGDIVLLDKVMAAYSLTPNSGFTGQGRIKHMLAEISFYQRVCSIIPAKWWRLTNAQLGKRYETLSYLLRKSEDYRASRLAAFAAFMAPDARDNVISKCKTLLSSVLREAQALFR